MINKNLFENAPNIYVCVYLIEEEYYFVAILPLINIQFIIIAFLLHIIAMG